MVKKKEDGEEDDRSQYSSDPADYGIDLNSLDRQKRATWGRGGAPHIP